MWKQGSWTVRPLYSGSDRGGGGGHYGGGESPPGCLQIIFETTLNSPEPEVIATLRVGQVLLVERQTVGTREMLLALRASDRATAGSITHDLFEDLIACMKEGHEYTATVLEVRGGLCRVSVRAKAALAP